MNNTVKKNHEKKSVTPLFAIVFRTILFLFLTQCVLMTFYFVGNFQNFLDSTQHLIIILIGIFSIIQVIFSLSGMIISIICLIVQRPLKIILKYIISTVSSFFSIIFSVIIILIFQTIDIISKGI